MTREIVTIQLGQCGNQIAVEFWKRLCKEHKISSDGKLIEEPGEINHTLNNLYFYETEKNTFVPRSLLIDLEPRVLNYVKNSEIGKLFNPEFIWQSEDGGGAGNIWSSGYAQAMTNNDELLNLLDKQVEYCDSLETFTLCHSICGGTGSGMGSYFLELIQDHYSKKLIQTYSVFPANCKTSSDVVVQPYNAVLSLARLASNCDAVHYIENSALNNLITHKLGIEKPTFASVNSLIAASMACLTVSMRCPSFMNTTMISILSPIIPISKAHFINDSISPIDQIIENSSLNFHPVKQKNSNPLNLISKLLLPNNHVAEINIHSGYYLGCALTICGQVDPYHVHDAINRIKEKNIIKFTPWVPDEIHYVVTKKNGFLNDQMYGINMSNHTSFKNTLRSIVKQFDILIKRQAFIDNYRRENIFDDDLSEFESARDTVETLIEEYVSAEEINEESD